MPNSPKAAPKVVSDAYHNRMLKNSKPTDLPLGALSLPLTIVKKDAPRLHPSPMNIPSTISISKRRKNRRATRKARKSNRKTRRCGCSF
jgi:hypothetical protein